MGQPFPDATTYNEEKAEVSVGTPCESTLRIVITASATLESYVDLVCTLHAYISMCLILILTRAATSFAHFAHMAMCPQGYKHVSMYASQQTTHSLLAAMSYSFGISIGSYGGGGGRPPCHIAG